jgi:hypothetical protein
MSNIEKTTVNQYKSRNCQNNKNLRNWTAGWVVSMMVVAFAPKYVWAFNTLLSSIAVVISLSIGLGMLLANRRYLRGLDEMQQKIQFDAMGLSLGVGLVVGLSYDLLEDIKLITFQPEIAHLVFIMCFAYMGGIIAGHRKFQ